MNPDNLQMIEDALDKAEYVRIVSGLELAFVWHGGAMVNIYSLYDWANTDCWTNYSLDHGNIAENIADHIEELVRSECEE